MRVILFKNRGFSWKLPAAVGLFAGACALSHYLGRWINPSPSLARAHPDRYEGKALWLPSSEVVGVDEHGFTVLFGDQRVAVRGRPDWVRVGDLVELTGEYAHPVELRLARARRVEIPWWRQMGNAVSIAVLLGVAWLFSRRFRIRPGAWELRWPTS